jgi:hypothetical protein
MAGSGLIGGVIVIAFGIINCFFGYLHFRLLLAVWGFLLGGSLGVSMTAQAAPLATLVAGIFGAVLGALLIYLLFRIGVFLAGAAFGYLLTAALLSTAGVTDSPMLLAGGGALLFGLLALMLNPLFIILVTAFSGASAILTGVALILDSERLLAAFSARQLAPAFQEVPAVVGVFWLILALTGVVTQYRARSGGA